MELLNESFPELGTDHPSKITGASASSLTSSWRNLFKEKDEQRLSFVPHVKASGNRVVKLPPEAVAEGVKKWENCLVGWFVGDIPDYRLVVSAVNKMWGKKSRVNVSKKGKLFILHFADLKLLQWVMENGPWYIGRRLFVVQRWNPSLSAGTINLQTIPLWVIFRNIPMHLYNNTCLSYIASAVGKPLYMDKGTTNLSHLDFARICIEVNIEDEIPNVIQVEAGENSFSEISMVVPWMPAKCTACNSFGHDCGENNINVMNVDSAEENEENKEHQVPDLPEQRQEPSSNLPDKEMASLAPESSSQTQNDEVQIAVCLDIQDKVSKGCNDEPLSPLPSSSKTSSREADSVSGSKMSIYNKRSEKKDSMETEDRHIIESKRGKKGRKKGKGPCGLDSAT